MMYRNRYYKDDIIRVYVGELIKDTDGTLWLIAGMERGDVYRFINMGTGFTEKHSWRDFKVNNSKNSNISLEYWMNCFFF